MDQTTKTAEQTYNRLLAEVDKSRINYSDSFFQMKPYFESLRLFDFFDRMPKGVLNHVHFPANVPLSTWLQIMKFPEVVREKKTHTFSVLDPRLGTPPGFVRTADLIESMGESSFRDLLEDLIYLHEEKASSGNPGIIFSEFEETFTRLSQVKRFWPIFELMMVSGLDFLARGNYSGFEVRLTLKLDKVGVDFSPIKVEDQVSLLVDLVKKWRQSNPGIGTSYNNHTTHIFCTLLLFPYSLKM